ncbi:MAG: MerR family transcriptional regulator [Candidatus Omnitrophota bacterium]
MNKPMEKNPEELLPLPMFLRELRTDYHIEMNRRTLQSYYSTYDGLLPKPTYKDGHTAHLKRKELLRARLIAFLRKNGWSLSEIRKLLDNLPNIDAISRIVNEVKTVSKVDWLLSEIAKTTPSATGMHPEFKTLIEAFLDRLGGRLEGVYNTGAQSGKEPQGVIDSARAEVQRQREEFFGRLDLIKEEVNSQEFEDRINGLLKEFRDKLKRHDTTTKDWVKDWIKNRFSTIVFNVIFRLG